MNKLELFNLPIKTSYYGKACFLILTKHKKGKAVMGKEKKKIKRRREFS